MKNFRPFTAILAAMLISAAAIFYSCSKQETEIQTNGTEPEQMTQADIDFQNQVMHFKDRLDYQREHPGYKSGEAMRVDSVVWYIETLFNAVYAYPEQNYSHTVTDTTNLIVALDADGLVSFNELSQAYIDLYEIIRTFYVNCGIINKGFVLLDLSILEINNDEATISVRAVTGEKANGSSGFSYFGDDDDWLYGNLWGDCDYMNAGTDAAEKIQTAIMETKPYIITPPGYTWVFSEIDTVHLYGYEYQNSNDEYLMFYIVSESGFFTHDEMCIETDMANNIDEMNFHYNGEFHIIHDILGPQLDKWFLECEIIGLEDSDLAGNTRIRHDNYLTFGSAHLVQNGTPFIIKEKLDD